MGDSFFNSFSKLIPGVNIPNQPLSKTIPATDCSNGSPISKYTGSGVYSYEVFYSIWCDYQKTLAAQFTTQQSLSQAPVSSLISGPANIFLCRHGEKNSGAAGYHLNNNGIFRACQMADFINVLAKDGYPISYIITCNPCPYDTSDPSMRPEQTIGLASFLLNIPTFIYGGSGDFDLTAEALYNGMFDGLNVLICWEHSAIQPLCLAIANVGVSNNRVSQPDADTFFLDNNACYNGNYEENSTNPNSSYVAPTQPQPNNDYTNSGYYPYWNNENFNLVYWFNSTIENPNFTFNIFQQPINTCFANCDQQICLYQPKNSYCTNSQEYYNKTSENIENKCELPKEWLIQMM